MGHGEHVQPVSHEDDPPHLSPMHILLCPSEIPTQLPIQHVPVPLTCGVFDGIIVTDPSLLEEELVTTQVTVVSTAAGQVRVLLLCKT